MRYFKTSNASRQYRAGGSLFSFEPVDQIGGSWLGVLALEESDASILAAANLPQVEAITEADYDALKKKPPARSASLQGPLVEQPSPPPRPAAQVVASRAPQVSEGGGAIEPAAPLPVALPVAGQGVTLETAVVEIADELVLETSVKSPTKRDKK